MSRAEPDEPEREHFPWEATASRICTHANPGIRLQSAAVRVIEALQRRGITGVAREAWRRTAAAIARQRRLLIFNAPLGEIRRIAPRLEAGMKFEARIATVAEGLRLGGSDTVLLSALRSHVNDVRNGEDLLVGCVDGRLAAWNIVSCGTRERWPLTETESELPLAPEDAVFTAGFVSPGFRGRRLFQAMYGASADVAAARGAQRMWSWCEDWNDASRRAMLAVGFRYAGSHSRRTILGVRGSLRVESPVSVASKAHD